MDDGFGPISLGTVCATKYQICRRLLQDAHPGASSDVVREALETGRASQVFPRHVFDWQVTPQEAVIAYLERNFVGVFEREDLTVSSQGEVVHRTLHTRHPHDFHPSTGEGLCEADLAAQYPVARRRFERLAERFRKHLRAPGRYLYVQSAGATREGAERLLYLLNAGAADRRCDLVLIGTAAEMADLERGRPHGVEVFVTPDDMGKPPERSWEGPDASWDALFDAHPIRPPAGVVFGPTLKRRGGAGIDLGEPVDLGWLRLPDGAPLGALPKELTSPTVPWSYAAMSGELSPFTDRSLTLTVSVGATYGDVGVALARPDGSEIVGREHRVSPEDGPIRLHFTLRPGLGRVCLLIRNYGFEGAISARLYGAGLSRED